MNNTRSIVILTESEEKFVLPRDHELFTSSSTLRNKLHALPPRVDMIVLSQISNMALNVSMDFVECHGESERWLASNLKCMSPEFTHMILESALYLNIQPMIERLSSIKWE